LQNKLYLIGNTQTGKKVIKTKEELQQLPFIFREKGSGTRQTMERFMEKHKISVLKKMELTSNEAVKQAVLAGLGYSIMPLIGIRNELHTHELQIISMKGLPITTTWSLIWLKEKKHSPVSAKFLAELKKTKSQIVHEKFNWYEQY
jgi:DNA-binding transcriptional LysR family regulator